MSRLMNFSSLLLFLANCALVEGIQFCVSLGEININSINPDMYLYGSTMSHEICKSRCTEYDYFLVRGVECNCADSATTWTTCSSCSTDPCSDNANEVCGKLQDACVYALKVTEGCPADNCQECAETLLSYECISCIPGFSIKDEPNVCTEDPPVDPVEPPTDPLKRCKKDFLYFARHQKKCGPVKERYPKWGLKHRGHGKQ